MALDEIDRKLLYAVQRNARLTAAEIGQACGLSPTAALKRYKKLKSDGVILGDVSIVEPEAVGLSVTMIVLVTLERERRDLIDAFKAAVRTEDRIMQGYATTGDADFMLVITARDVRDYETFTQDFFYDQHRVKNFKTLVVLDKIKLGMTVPLL